MIPLHPGDPRELVRLDVVYHDETYDLSDPVPRQIALDALSLFALGVPVRGRRVIRALIVPEVP